MLHRVPQERLTERYVERRQFLEGVSGSYSASRASGGGPVPLARPGRATWSFRRLKPLLRDRARDESLPRKWTALRNRVHEAHEAGYVYHQKQMNSDPLLRAWVLLADYWGAEVPDAESSLSRGGRGHVRQRKLEE